MPTARTVYLPEPKPDHAPVVKEENVNLNYTNGGNNIVLASDPAYMLNQRIGAYHDERIVNDHDGKIPNTHNHNHIYNHNHNHNDVAQNYSTPFYFGNGMKNCAPHVPDVRPDNHTSSGHGGASSPAAVSDEQTKSPALSPPREHIHIEHHHHHHQGLPPHQAAYHHHYHHHVAGDWTQQQPRHQHTMALPYHNQHQHPTMIIPGYNVRVHGRQHLVQHGGQVISIPQADHHRHPRQSNPIEYEHQRVAPQPSLDDYRKNNSMNSNSGPTVSHPKKERNIIPNPNPPVTSRVLKESPRPTSSKEVHVDDDKVQNENITKDPRNDVRQSKEKPRRPLNAYNFYFSEEREVIMEEVKFAMSEGGTKPWDGEKNSPLNSEQVENILEKPPILPPAHLNDLRSKINQKTLLVLNTRKESEKNKKVPHRKTHGIGFRPLSMAIAKRWKTLAADRKKHYKNLAKMDLDRYTTDMNEFAAKMLKSTNTNN